MWYMCVYMCRHDVDTHMWGVCVCAGIVWHTHVGYVCVHAWCGHTHVVYVCLCVQAWCGHTHVGYVCVCMHGVCTCMWCVFVCVHVNACGV